MAATEWDALTAAAPHAVTLAAVEAAQHRELSPANLVDALRCCERLLSHVAGMQATLISEFARPGRSGDVSRIVEATVDIGGLALRSGGHIDTDVLDAVVTEHARGLAAAELAAALTISPITARHRVEAAIDLHDGLPLTHRALTAGVLDRGRAALIAECTSTLEPELRLEVETKIVPLVVGRTSGRLRALIERAVLIADPETTNKRIEKAKRGREVTHRPLRDQLSSIRAVLPADGAVTVFTLIDLMAGSTRTAGDDRSVAERRADALTDLATELLTHGQLDLHGLLDGHTSITEEDGGADAADFEDQDSPSDSNTWYDEHWHSAAAGCPLPDMPDHKAHPAEPSTAVVGTREGCGRSDLDGEDPEVVEEPDQPAIPDTGPAEPKDAEPTPASPRRIGVPGGQDRRNSVRHLTRQGRRPHLTVTMSLSTLMALDQLPAHLEGYGAITAELAMTIAAAAASVTVAVVNPTTGSPQHASGRFGYRPSQKQRDIVTTLATTCRFPSCRQPAWRCDLDHRDAYDHDAPHRGGPTCPCNLDPHCRHHHLLKHHTDWTARRAPDGSMFWTSPTGHLYTDAPTELTLPGELLTPSDRPRTATGLADEEHIAECAEPLRPEDPTPFAVKVHLAQRRAFHAQVLERIRSAQRLGLLGNRSAPAPEPMGPPDAELIRSMIARTFQPAQSDSSPRTGMKGASLVASKAIPLPDDAHPPF